MGGLFGVASNTSCTMDLFFGTDYHSHLGVSRGGLAVYNGKNFAHTIHKLSNSQFRSKFEADLPELSGNLGIGCISDSQPQPITLRSRHGTYALTTVGNILNVNEIMEALLESGNTHFFELSTGNINQTELVASIINSNDDFLGGIKAVLDTVKGSNTMLAMTTDGIYAVRDKFGRTPLVIGKGDNGYCVCSETCAMPNIGYEPVHELGAGEVCFITADGYETLVKPGKKKQVCAFLWTYYGYPSSCYEGRTVECVRCRVGELMAEYDKTPVDLVGGIPDSGVPHAMGYANGRKIPYGRPFVKYTPTWPRSFMPANKDIRNLVAHMKLLPVHSLIKDKRLLLCDDSIVRGTQLSETAAYLFSQGAKEVHVRVSCPPILYGCKFLNFSSSPSPMDLISRRVISELENDPNASPDAYVDCNGEKYKAMVKLIGEKLKLSSVMFATLEDMLKAIDLPEDQVCTYCWSGKGEDLC